MYSKDAKTLIDCLVELHKKTGKSRFDSMAYMKIPNYKAAVRELVDKNILTDHNDVIGSVSLNLDMIED